MESTPPTTAPTPGLAAKPAPKSATTRQIRGSSFLLIGRILAMAINQAVQIMIVRYLAQNDYGAFALALSVIALGESIVTFGLDRAVGRFLPIYQEEQRYDKFFGTLVLVGSTVAGFSAALILLVYMFQAPLTPILLNDDPVIAAHAMKLLLIMIFLAPVQAIDTLLVGMFAVLANPRSIFWRKHVLAPGLKLLVVLLLIAGGQNVFFLAGGYVAAGAIGAALYIGILVQVMRKEGLLAQFNPRTIRIPAREVLFFTIPLLSTDLVYVLMTSMDALLLGYFHGTAEVAAFRAVQPTARLNQTVFTSFALLYTPLAARLFAKKDRDGVNNLYWQTAIWIAVFSFPIFVLTFSLAVPMTVLFYGERYRSSASILALLSFGYYFNAALGFNGTTLTVFKKVRYTIVINILAAVVNLSLNLLLIPKYGAVGAAIGTCATLVAHNIAKQVGLRFGTGINLFEWRYFKTYLTIILGAVGLLALQLSTSMPLYVDLGLAVSVSALVLMLNRSALNVEQTFPEVLKIPGMRRLLGTGR
jgi:O-antigen/teichoic acid export membrane protein